MDGLTVTGGTATFNGASSGLSLTRGTVNFNGNTVDLNISGGTVNFGNDVKGVTFSGGTPSIDFDGGILSVNTAEGNVAFRYAVSSNWGVDFFVKKGAGTLTSDGLPQVNTIKVEEGTLALTSESNVDMTSVMPELAHRWSFTDGSLEDSAGSSTAVEKGSGATFANGAVTLPGGSGGTCYIEMGKGIMPDSGVVTIEVWGTQDAAQSYSRIFTIGTANNDFLSMFWSNPADVNSDVVQMKNYGSGNADDIYVRDTMYPYTHGTKFHISMTIVQREDGKADVSWTKRDAVTGEILKSASAVTKGVWSLAKYNGNETFVIGHGFDNNDANATYDEVRVWRVALSADQLTASAKAGPDATNAKLVSALGIGRVLDLAGGTLDLGGRTLTQPVVKGDGGTVENGTLVVSDRLVLNVGDCITASGTVDLTNAKIEIVDPENIEQFRFITAAEGSTLSIVGTPELENLPIKWLVSVSQDGARIVKRGFSVIVR